MALNRDEGHLSEYPSIQVRTYFINGLRKTLFILVAVKETANGLMSPGNVQCRAAVRLGFGVRAMANR